jgi:HEAT repeat protein
MCFLFRVRFHLRFWLVCMMALVLGAGEGVMAQQYFTAPAQEEAADEAAPWRERGLRSALADPSPEVRSYAVEFIAGTRWAATLLSVKEVLPLLRSKDEKIRMRAAQALGPQGVQDAAYLKEMLPLLHSQDEHVVYQALNVLSSLGRAAAPYARELLPLLQSPDEWVRARAVKTLGRLGPAAVQYARDLVPLLRDEKYNVLQAAAEALGFLGREDAAAVVPLLQPHLTPWPAAPRAATGDPFGAAPGPPPAAPDASKPDPFGAAPGPPPAAPDASKPDPFGAAPGPPPAAPDASKPDPFGAAPGPPPAAPDASKPDPFGAAPGPPPAAPDASKPDPFGAAPGPPPAAPDASKPDPFGAAPAPAPAAETPPTTLPMRSEWPRDKMAAALGCMGADAVPLAAPVLALLLTDGDPLMPRAAELALFRLGYEAPAATAQALLPLLQTSPDDPNLVKVVDFLGLLGPQAAPVVVPALLPLLQPQPQPQPQTPQASATQGEQAGAKVASFPRDRAVEALGHLSAGSDPAAVGALLQLLKSPELSMRRAAAHALRHAGQQAVPQVVSAMLPLLKDADKDLRSSAISALTKAGRDAVPQEVTDALRALLKDPDPDVRDHAAFELHHLRESGQSLMGAPTPADLKKSLPEMLRDAAPDVRARAAEALAQAAEKQLPPEILRAILPLIKDPEYYVRADVIDALATVQAGTPAAPQIISALRPVLEDTTPYLRCSAALILHRLGVDTATCLQAVKPLLQGPPMPHQTNALSFYEQMAPELPVESIAPALIPLLSVPDQHVCLTAADILQRLGPKLDPYAKEILPLFQHSDSTVQWAAANALSSPGPDAAPLVVRALLKWIKTDDDKQILAVNILGRLGSAATPEVLTALTPLLRQTGDGLRTRVAIALGRMGPAAAPAAKDLIAVIEGADPALGFSSDDPKYPAAEALGQLGPGVVPIVLPALLACFEKEDGILGFHASLALQNLGPQIMPAMLSTEMARWHKAGAPPAKIWGLDDIDRWGNRSADPACHCAALAALLEFAGTAPAQRLRFHLHYWSGHSEELLLSLRWLGRPAADPMPTKGKELSSEEQQAVLRMLLKLWDASAPYPAVRREMARRSADVAQSITAAPDEKLTALLIRMDASLKADAIKETQPDSSAARSAVQSALAVGKGKQ